MGSRLMRGFPSDPVSCLIGRFEIVGLLTRIAKREKRLVGYAGEILTAFLELESATQPLLKAVPLFEFATYRQFPARVRKGVFENLDRYGLDPTRDRSGDGRQK